MKNWMAIAIQFFFEKIFAAKNNACIFAFHFGNGYDSPEKMGRSVKRKKIKKM